jgi:hypothetical protein
MALDAPDPIAILEALRAVLADTQRLAEAHPHDALTKVAVASLQVAETAVDGFVEREDSNRPTTLPDPAE